MYLSLESLMNPIQVTFVPGDDLVAIERAHSVLLRERAVGIDTEWKPVVMKGQAEGVSILQISGTEEVFLLDILESLSPPMEGLLKSLFRSKEILKVGYAVMGDFRQLHRAYPDSDAFSFVSQVVDLQGPLQEAVEALLPSAPKAEVKQKGKKKQIKGLSAIARDVLGLPLDKSATMSNWERRPLDDRQVSYAALDALAPLRCLERLLVEPLYDRSPSIDAFRQEVASIGSVQVVHDVNIITGTSHSQGPGHSTHLRAWTA